jgi:hypothetical protein
MSKHKKQNAQPKFSIDIICKQCEISFDVGVDDLYLYKNTSGMVTVMADCVCGRPNKISNVPQGIMNILLETE